MSIPFDENVPNEETEAKLCAYLEGELTPEERADIETHLKNNPQYRQLLRELSATRFVLQGLPTEKAPGEVAESFHGQLERSMLLDGGSNSDPLVRIRHWPQFALVAAMVLLAAGLGVIVYIILPGPVQKYSVAPPPVTVMTGPPGAAPAVQPARSLGLNPTIVPNEPTTSSQLQAPAVTAPHVAEEVAAAAKDQSKELAIEATAPQASRSIVSGEVDRLKKPSEQFAQQPAAVAAPARMLDKSVIEQLADTGLAENLSGRVCVVVHTNDLLAADKQLRNYFVSNSIPYQAMGDAIAPADTPMNGANESVDLKLKATTQAAGVASTQSIAVDGTQQNSVQQEIAVNTALPTSQRTIRNRAPLVAMEGTSAANPVFVAKAMTRKETDQLRAVLSNTEAGQTAELFPGEEAKREDNRLENVSLSPASQPTIVGPATIPATQPIAAVEERGLQAGDQLTVTVAQLVGPGMDKTNTVRVAENGTIILPMIEPVPAAGLSTAELQKQIADRYRDANLIPDAKVNVSAIATTQPTDSVQAAATQPAEPERVDVVVVIEKNAPVSTTQPATAPTADAPGAGPMQP